MERRRDLSPVLHAQPLLQQEDPQLQVEVLPLKGVDPLAVVPHRPVEAEGGVAARDLGPAHRVRVVPRGGGDEVQHLGASP